MKLQHLANQLQQRISEVPMGSTARMTINGIINSFFADIEAAQLNQENQEPTEEEND